MAHHLGSYQLVIVRQISVGQTIITKTPIRVRVALVFFSITKHPNLLFFNIEALIIISFWTVFAISTYYEK